MAIKQYRADQHLENKSKLVFNFDSDQEGPPVSKVLEFMENISITESVSTNYSQYTPIGSNGSQFAYLGTKSREFDLSFNITLPHILENTLIKPETTNFVMSKKYKQSLFFGQNSDFFNSNNHNNKYSEFIRAVDRQHSNLLTDTDRDLGAQENNLTGTHRETALIKIMFWVNLIRASCITSATKPYLGPPLVRLYHGILYSNIPCIVNKYNITYDQMNGFDAKTLLPRVINVKLSLQEVRLRGKKYHTSIAGDYTPGWDSMFVEDSFVTLDPNIPEWA